MKKAVLILIFCAVLCSPQRHHASSQNLKKSWAEAQIAAGMRDTWLMNAVKKGSPVLVKLHLNLGANPAATDKAGLSALDWAQKKVNEANIHGKEKKFEDAEAIVRMLEEYNNHRMDTSN